MGKRARWYTWPLRSKISKPGFWWEDESIPAPLNWCYHDLLALSPYPYKLVLLLTVRDQRRRHDSPVTHWTSGCCTSGNMDHRIEILQRFHYIYIYIYLIVRSFRLTQKGGKDTKIQPFPFQNENYKLMHWKPSRIREHNNGETSHWEKKKKGDFFYTDKQKKFVKNLQIQRKEVIFLK